jgi:hypothetical protein
MHYLYFVKLAKNSVKTAKEALIKARHVLDNNSFATKGGYFNSKADWYVVGGRWSGEFQLWEVGEAFSKEVKKAKLFKNNDFVSYKEIEDNKDALQTIWKKVGGKGINPYGRDSYSFLGYEDDAVKITAKTIKLIKKRFAKNAETEVFCAEDFEERYIKDLNNKDIGDWLVVIDYHN